MASSLYQKAYQEMVNSHSHDFAQFGDIHDKFKSDQTKWKKEFDLIGKPIVRLIEETENRLCSKMEGSGRGNYSSNLSDKFRAEVRSHFPLIDFVGVTIE